MITCHPTWTAFSANLQDSSNCAQRWLGPSQTEKRKPEAPEVRAPLHILVIDDHPLVAAALRDILERDGHHTLVTHGGKDGVEAFRTAQQQGEPFAVVLTDFSLKDLDGLGVAAAVKEMSAATFVILITAYSGRCGRGDLPANVDALLGKPPRLHDLRAALARSASDRRI